MPLRASAPPKKPAASRPSTPKARASSAPGTHAPRRTSERRREGEGGHDEADGRETEEREAVDGWRREATRPRRGGRGARARAATRRRRATPSIEPGPHGRRRVDARGLERRQERRRQGRGAMPTAAATSHGAAGARAGDARRRQVDARDRSRDGARAPRATRRARALRRGACRRSPTASPSARKAAKIAAREVPSARSVAISGRRRSTAIETALAIRKIPTSSVSEPRAFRLKRKARTIRSAVSAARPGRSSESPAAAGARSRAGAPRERRRGRARCPRGRRGPPCRAGPAP